MEIYLLDEKVDVMYDNRRVDTGRIVGRSMDDPDNTTYDVDTGEKILTNWPAKLIKRKISLSAV